MIPVLFFGLVLGGGLLVVSSSTGLREHKLIRWFGFSLGVLLLLVTTFLFAVS